MKELIKEIGNTKDSKRISAVEKKFPLSKIKEFFDCGDIIPQPDSQLDYVYDDVKASMLIELALLNNSTPTIYLSEKTDETFSFIYGQQILTSFVRFLRNEFKLKKMKVLSNLKGHYFKDLDKTMQENLKSVLVNTIILTKE